MNGQAPLTRGQVKDTVPTQGALEALCSLRGRGEHGDRLAWWAAKLGKRTQRAAYRRDMDRPRGVPGGDGPAARHKWPPDRRHEENKPSSHRPTGTQANPPAPKESAPRNLRRQPRHGQNGATAQQKGGEGRGGRPKNNPPVQGGSPK